MRSNSKFLLMIFLIFVYWNPLFSLENFDIVKQIKQRGKIVVLILKEDQYPFFYQKNTTIVGYDLVLCQKIAETLGIQLAIDRRALTIDDLINRLNRGEGDIAVGKIKKTINDALYLSYSKPYLNLKYVLVLNRVEVSKYKDKATGADLLRKKKAVLGTLNYPLYQEYLNKYFPDNPHRFYTNIDGMIQDLKAGKIVAAFLDEVEGKLIFKNNPADGIDLQYTVFDKVTDNLYIACSWQNKALVAWLNIFLDIKYQKSTINTIIENFAQ